MSGLSALSAVLDRIDRGRGAPSAALMARPLPRAAPAQPAAAAAAASAAPAAALAPAPVEAAAQREAGGGDGGEGGGDGDGGATNEKAEGGAAEAEACELKVPAATGPTGPSVDQSLAAEVWYEYLDPSSQKCYYHNYVTQQTSWVRPASFVPHNAYLGPGKASAAATGDYTFRANFNKQSGRFTGEDYWDTHGIPRDRSARQLAAFVDLKELEANREAARRTRALAAQSKSAEEWREHNSQRKAEKKRKRDAWLLTEDDD